MRVCVCLRVCARGCSDTLVLPGSVADVLCGWLQAGAPLYYTGDVKGPSGDVRRLGNASGTSQANSDPHDKKYLSVTRLQPPTSRLPSSSSKSKKAWHHPQKAASFATL